MNAVAEFEKVPFHIYRQKRYGWEDEPCRKEYRDIPLPQRATEGSAGYDFYAPFSFDVLPDKPILIPTGIRCKINEGWFLAIYPRSGSGFKKGLALRNTVGIIDSDFYNSDSMGHIMLMLTTEEGIHFNKGDRFAQGIFMPFGTTVNDEVITEKRTGGFGSTDEKK